jgi:hypothetical protein
VNKATLLFLIKFTHTLVFFVETAAIFYILYSALTGTYDTWLIVAIMAVVVETVVYLGNRARCPMTKLALRLGDKTGDDFIADIFLPKWFAPLIPPICGVLAVSGLLMIGVRLLLAK